MPVPVRLAVCGLPAALSLTLKVPDLAPVEVGEKVTLMVHFAFAARLLVQVVADSAKLPVVEIEMPVKDTACLLVKVNLNAALVVPTLVAGKACVAGVNVAWTVPVPDNATVCGLFGALSVMVRVPVRAPTAVGVNVTSIVQVLPAASVLPQGFALVV